MNELVKRFSEELECAILNLEGFKKSSRDIFHYPLDKEISGWLGINQGTQFGSISLNPVIGITHRSVQKIDWMLSQVKPTKKLYPVVNEPLRYLSDKYYSPKLVESHEDVSVEVDRMIKSIKLFAIPFYINNANLKSILDLILIKKYGHPNQVIYSVPIIYHLLGKTTEGIKFMKNELDNMKQRSSPLIEDYEKFSDNFLIYINEGKLPPLEECRKI